MTFVRDPVISQNGARAVTELEEVREHFYVISPERKVKQPAVAHIVERAKDDLFVTAPS